MLLRIFCARKYIVRMLSGIAGDLQVHCEGTTGASRFYLSYVYFADPVRLEMGFAKRRDSVDEAAQPPPDVAKLSERKFLLRRRARAYLRATLKLC